MSATFNFSVSTSNPQLAAAIAKVIADHEAAHPGEHVSVNGNVGGNDAMEGVRTDAALVQQIVDALTYHPLHPHQILTLRTWYGANDWVHVSALQQKLISNGLAGDAKEATARVRGLLAGFALRMEQKVKHPLGRTKLAVLVDVDYRDGSASHRLTDSGREAVKRVLKL